MKGLTLLSVSNQTATVTGESLDLGALYPVHGVIIRSYVNVDSVSGGTVTVKVEDSLDGILWRVLYTFSAHSTQATSTEHYTPSVDSLVVMPFVRGIATATSTIQYDAILKIAVI